MGVFLPHRHAETRTWCAMGLYVSFDSTIIDSERADCRAGSVANPSRTRDITANLIAKAKDVVARAFTAPSFALATA